MSRQARLTTKDWEKICAYVDDALDEKERAEFETRLNSSPEMQAALKEQAALNYALCRLPQYKAPRNFTLTHIQAAEVKRARQPARAFGWASAALAVLLVVAFSVDLLGSSNLLPAAAPEALQQSYEGTLMASIEPAEGIYLLNWDNPMNAKGGGGGGSISVPPAVMVSEAMAEEAMPEDADPLMTMEQPTSEGVEEDAVITGKSVESVAPIIYGIQADNLGSVVHVFPDEARLEQLRQVGQHAADKMIIPTNIKVLLAGLLVVSLVIWLYLRRR